MLWWEHGSIDTPSSTKGMAIATGNKIY